MSADYQLVYHERFRGQLRECTKVLLRAGWKMDRITEILTAMETHLRDEPLEYGEAKFHLRPLDLIITIVCARPFAVHVGVSESTRTVFIRDVVLMTSDKT